MEKEKILLQLKDKLLPFIQNIEKDQATEHDYFPALLWMLLETSKDSKNSLNDISLRYGDELKNISATILETNKVSQEKAENLLSDILLKNNEIFTNISAVILGNNKVSSENIKSISTTMLENHKVSQEKTISLVESKIVAISQKIEDLKSTPLKIEKKFPIGFLILSIFQFITLTIVAVILMKQL